MKKKLKLAGALLGATLVTTGAVASGHGGSHDKKDKNGTEMMDANKTAKIKKEVMHTDKKVGTGK